MTFAEPEASTDSIPHPLAKQAAPVATPPPVVPQGDDLTSAAEPYLGYLSELSGRLGVLDPVETYFRPLLGRWSDLSAEAGRLRQAATAAAEVSDRLEAELGRLDAGWEGRDADSFVAYIREVAAAGGDLQEALNVLAGALDDMVETLRHVVVDLIEVLVDAADLTSETMLLPSGGAKRARAQLHETQDSAKALYETAQDVLEAFDRLCDGVDDPDGASRTIEIKHRYPQEKFKLHDGALNEAGAEEAAAAGGVTPSSAGEATTPSSADPAEPKHTAAGTPDAQPAAAAPPDQPDTANHATTSGMPMMPMMGFGSFGGGGGGGRRQPKSRQPIKSSELLGEPEMVAPPVIGEDENAPQKKQPPPKNPPAK
ncbi:WXG100 family type VII secretion target [Amycolatopsis sp. OK19-0408]|uniref:WXG100 family type VII secretion target n=1 Tax=Amycolatopsis iheyensis TaxID=2945988 RepID=A0A9X2NE61_9PSEU|nr:WXG100 family type VII secretion target [Amycolatopsis iheyensis]MCR6485210.1 WXG100 family type VII secretion target [Amycolatopsis iheyensis]